MRVVGGAGRGKKLQVVPGKGTRPILDRVKTSLFDILRPRLDGMVVLDLFAGSGSVGIEALSQGAAFCTFNELVHKAVATIKKNLALAGFADRAEVRQGDAFALLRSTDRCFDLIYVAPPQYQALWSEALKLIAERPGLLRKQVSDSNAGLVIAQIDPKEYENFVLGSLREIRQKQYGNTLLVFYEKADAIDIAD
jgi:16S rRNA (guanine(966)-N(2))-methyltransferase RsmD